MSSYLSNLLTHTTSKYNSLRRTLLSSEEDGDTEDDTNVCRVLRAYYNEKGRSFPPWLPPDPNDRKSITAAPAPGLYSQPSSYFSGAAAGGGGRPTGPVPAGSRATLSDLWDTPSSASPQPTPNSLRNARRPGNNPAPGGGGSSLAAPRPLPSQRAGSFQNQQQQQQQQQPPQQQQQPSYMSATAMARTGMSSGGMPAGGGGGGGGGAAGGAGGSTAQDRLKARLWGARGGGAGTPSPPSSSVGAPNPYDQPSSSPQQQQQRQQQQQQQQQQYQNPYGTGERRYGR